MKSAGSSRGRRESVRDLRYLVNLLSSVVRGLWVTEPTKAVVG